MTRDQALLILHLHDTPTKEEIKKSYRKLSKLYHPDIAKDDGHKFRILNEAYELLINEGEQPKQPSKKIRVKFTIENYEQIYGNTYRFRIAMENVLEMSVFVDGRMVKRMTFAYNRPHIEYRTSIVLDGIKRSKDVKISVYYTSISGKKYDKHYIIRRNKNFLEKLFNL